MFSRGIIAAMEDETQVTELAIDEAGSDSMEADMVDVVDMSSDIESGADEMAQTVADADQLERHVEVLTDAEADGGASPELIEATEIAVEGIFNKLGIYGDTGIPSLESFSTKAGRARSTRLAIESIKEKIGMIWEAVKAAFTKMVNYVKDFLGKLFDTKKKVLARITALEVKAKNIKGIKKDDKVKGAGIGSFFGDKAEAIKEFLESKSTIQSVAAEIADTLEKKLPELLAGVASQAAFDAVKFEPTKGRNISGKAPQGLKYVSYHDYRVGVHGVATSTAASTVSGAEAYKLLSQTKFGVSENTLFKPSKEDVSALEKADIDNYLKKSREIITYLMNEKSLNQSVSEKLDKNIAEINRIISLKEADDETLTKRSQAVRSAISNVASNAIKATTIMNSLTIRGVQSTLTYVERSIANFDGSADKAKDKE